MKKKDEFNWEDTGNLKIRYNDKQSASLRFFPSDKVIAETAAKFIKKPAIESKSKTDTIPHKRKKKPLQGR